MNVLKWGIPVVVLILILLFLFRKKATIHDIFHTIKQSLSEKINTELKDLEMLNSIFEIKIERLQEFNINGLNKVEFYICTNIGEKKNHL